MTAISLLSRVWICSVLIAGGVCAAEPPAVSDFRFPLPGESTVKPTPIDELNRSGLQPPPSPVVGEPHAPVIEGSGASRGQTDSLGQAISPAGKVLGTVDSLGRVIEPGSGAIRGQTPAAGQPLRPLVK
ncbi:hypothetical protein [Aestuariirhabdus litorea]|uniref:Uncharacterized protein n=1 Tax=Aestuariirhabdus litorea TaxID=2528527 RepID=A0A3P3VNC1_9GAMM|nr:hypothetical protein [Aestuariirhabdus litorea]RRJ84195.1 hypothetical protein D0544_03520 [Aestuariirhabdus litorea]RWW97416.1 hypothetical protein DZC74_03515 [Endozoicomonadaceae bacterium GTF-13]